MNSNQEANNRDDADTKTALVVIDIQSYFLRHSPKDLPLKIAERISKSSYACVAFTIVCNPDSSNFTHSLHWKACKTEEDLKLPEEFRGFIKKDNVFKKSTYSAFKAEGFEEYLKANDIQKIELCGIDSDACVLATAYEAFDKNYEVSILFDLSYSRYDLQNAVEKIAARNIQSRN